MKYQYGLEEESSSGSQVLEDSNEDNQLDNAGDSDIQSTAEEKVPFLAPGPSTPSISDEDFLSGKQ